MQNPMQRKNSMIDTSNYTVGELMEGSIFEMEADQGFSTDPILIVVDVQNDFLAGGALEVGDANSVIPYINERIDSGEYQMVVATQDWHPPEHGSFASAHPGKKPFDMGELDGLPQVLWPDHCVQGTFGAEFPETLSHNINAIVRKGMNPDRDSYSGVKDNGDRDTAYWTGLDMLISNVEACRVDVVGLATDYCVGFTALDLNDCGFEVRVLLKGCRGVAPESTREMISRLIEAGVEVVGWDS
jgi:nicotinamidase/pyrazinamidase